MSFRTEVARAVVVYNLKLWLSGFAAALLIPISLWAALIDLLIGRGLDDGLLGTVLRTSAKLEAEIDVHGALTDIRLVDADPARADPAGREQAAPRV